MLATPVGKGRDDRQLLALKGFLISIPAQSFLRRYNDNFKVSAPRLKKIKEEVWLRAQLVEARR